jgi:hypothetical protein
MIAAVAVMTSLSFHLQKQKAGAVIVKTCLNTFGQQTMGPQSSTVMTNCEKTNQMEAKIYLWV